MNSQGGDRFVLRNFGSLGETERQSASDDFIECSRPETLKMFGQDILCYYGTKSFIAVCAASLNLGQMSTVRAATHKFFSVHFALPLTEYRIKVGTSAGLCSTGRNFKSKLQTRLLWHISWFSTMSTGENLDITSNYVPCVSNLLFIDHH
jgi:hypothetical protein